MFFTIIGVLTLLYTVIYIISLIYLDCDISLFLAEKFGKPISSLRGKVVFITGASSGIGEYLAVTLARNGVKLVLGSRQVNELERVKEICLEESKGMLQPEDIFILEMDMLKTELHQQYFETALKHFGCIDILVNNAGRSQRASWVDTELDVDRDLFELNVFSVVSLSRIAVKYFQENKKGHIAVTSSIGGLFGVPFSGAYNGTKHAIQGYFKCLRVENSSSNLTVSIFCPGPVQTNLLRNCFTESVKKTYKEITMKKDTRMTGERCGYLYALTLANKLDETWVSIQPFLPLVTLSVYFPNIYKIAMTYLGGQKFNELRNGK